MRKIDYNKYLLETEDDYSRARLDYMEWLATEFRIGRMDIDDVTEPPHYELPCVAVFENERHGAVVHLEVTYVGSQDLKAKPKSYLDYRLTRLLWPALKNANVGFSCLNLPATKADISFYYFDGKPFGIAAYTDEEYSTVRFYKADSALLRNNEKLVDASPEAFIQSIFDSSIKVKEDFFSHSDQEVLNTFFKLVEIPLQKD